MRLKQVNPDARRRVARSPAEAASNLHLNLLGKRRRTKKKEGWSEKPRPQEIEEGKGQAQGPQAPQAVQEVRMGVRAFRPPPNLMRVGKSP